MRRLAASLALALLAGSACQAGPVVTLSSTTPDLGQIQVGDVVRFDVTLSGLNPGDSLSLLTVSVDFPGLNFGAPENISPSLAPSGIVPEIGGFSGSISGGTAVGFYETLNVIPPPDFFPDITSNGLYFSVTVTALAAGSGTITFSNLNSIGFDATGRLLDTAVGENELTFTVRAGAVPEPSSMMLLGGPALAAATLVLARTRRLRLA